MGTVSDVNVAEVPGGLFTLDMWLKISTDLLQVVMDAHPQMGVTEDWRFRVKPQTKQWAIEYMEYMSKQKRLARERALEKLTHDDKVALGLEG